MNRRNFLSLFGLGVAGIAVEQAIPLGRVWSFPKTIVVPAGNVFLRTDWITSEALRQIKQNVQMGNFVATNWDKVFRKNLVIARTLEIKLPQQFNLTPADPPEPRR